MFVTHYHDDHTDGVQAAADRFHCPVYATAEMRDILEQPGAYRLPALTTNPVRALQTVREGEKQRWHEFEFTYSYFPGQTLYHDALLVKKDGGETVFFIGDSFTATGIDDYCLLNRNFFEPEIGFQYCLNVLRKLDPQTLLVNQHVDPAFRFSQQQLDFMIDTMRKRAELVREVSPWGDANLGVDEQWARFYPYGIEVPAGKPFELKVIIRNHSDTRREYRVTPHVPEGWKAAPGTARAAIGPRQDGSVSLRFTAPRAGSGVAVVTADVAFGGWDLREWAEALVTVR